MRKLLFSLAACAAATVLPLSAHAALKTEVFVETTIVGPDGASQTKRAPAAKVVPGDHVVYVITFVNDAAKPADGVTITNPVPEGLAYAGPAEGPAPLVSTDGATFAPLALLSLRRPDGSTTPAQAGDVVQLRWTLPAAVPAGGQARLTYRATLK
jgi:uncharacterized repeat protein (TIGR01451 family)